MEQPTEATNADANVELLVQAGDYHGIDGIAHLFERLAGLSENGKIHEVWDISAVNTARPHQSAIPQ